MNPHLPKWWISWYDTGVPFTLETPWWISGYVVWPDEQATICAAVAAPDAEAAMKIIRDAHDTAPGTIQWRFVDERPVDWQPFTDRFPRADWMKWI